MYPASAKQPCPDGIRAPGPHHLFGLNGLGLPQVFQELVRPVLPSAHHRILVGEFTFTKIPCASPSSRLRPRMCHYKIFRRPPTASSISKPLGILRFSPGSPSKCAPFCLPEPQGLCAVLVDLPGVATRGCDHPPCSSKTEVPLWPRGSIVSEDRNLHVC